MTPKYEFYNSMNKLTLWIQIVRLQHHKVFSDSSQCIPCLDKISINADKSKVFKNLVTGRTSYNKKLTL